MDALVAALCNEGPVLLMLKRSYLTVFRSQSEPTCLFPQTIEQRAPSDALKSRIVMAFRDQLGTALSGIDQPNLAPKPDQVRCSDEPGGSTTDNKAINHLSFIGYAGCSDIVCGIPRVEIRTPCSASNSTGGRKRKSRVVSKPCEIRAGRTVGLISRQNRRTAGFDRQGPKA